MDPAWGLTDLITFQIHARAMVGLNSWDHGRRESTATWRTYCTNLCFLVANLNLPQGARVFAIELEAYDAHASHFMSCSIGSCPVLGASCDLESVSTGEAFDGGHDFFSHTLASPITVDNHDNTYFAECYLNATGESVNFRTFRIFYRLQVSAAPGTATFSDVPVGSFGFKHVEALAASGITAGCGGGNFCPDREITRVEMAVFLAKALGLHWPG